MSETNASPGKNPTETGTAPVSPILHSGTPMRQEHTGYRWTAPVGLLHRKLARKAAAHDRRLRFAGVGLTDTSDQTTRGLF